MNQVLTPQDWMKLSAFLDGQLTVVEHEEVERFCALYPTWRAGLSALEHTRILLRSAPKRGAPRNFTISEKVANSIRKPARGILPLRWVSVFSSAMAAVLLLIAMQLTRPMTALAVALPFVIHGLVRLRRGNWAERRRLLAVAFAGLLGVGLYLLWQYSLSGDPLLNPYSLWWPYDRVVFGPEIGVTESGHTIRNALSNLRLNFFAGSADLFGWGVFSFLFLAFNSVKSF